MRHCGECDLTVYNLSEMSLGEIEALLTKKEGRVCIRFYRRADGTVLVDDCPVGLREARRQVLRLALFLLGVLSSVATSFARAVMFPVELCRRAAQSEAVRKEPSASPAVLGPAIGVHEDAALVPASEPEGAFCFFTKKELAYQSERKKASLVRVTGGSWTMGVTYAPSTYLAPGIPSGPSFESTGEGAAEIQRQLEEAKRGYLAAERDGNGPAAVQWLLRRNALDKRLRAIRSGQ